MFYALLLFKLKILRQIKISSGKHGDFFCSFFLALIDFFSFVLFGYYYSIENQIKHVNVKHDRRAGKTATASGGWERRKKSYYYTPLYLSKSYNNNFQIKNENKNSTNILTASCVYTATLLSLSSRLGTRLYKTDACL